MDFPLTDPKCTKPLRQRARTQNHIALGQLTLLGADGSISGMQLSRGRLRTGVRSERRYKSIELDALKPIAPRMTKATASASVSATLVQPISGSGTTFCRDCTAFAFDLAGRERSSTFRG